MLERTRVVLVRPQHPGNVGAVARAMANTGLSRLVVVDPPALDLERARWMASAGRSILDEATLVETVGDAVSDCVLAVGTTARARRYNWPVWEPQELATRTLDADGPVALLFGQEDAGLDNEALSHCQALLNIPTAGLPSLNLAQAVLVTCWAVFSEARARGYEPEQPVRQGRRSGGAPVVRDRRQVPKATLDQQRLVVDEALGLLERTPYMLGRTPEMVRVFVSGLLQRTRPDMQDLAILRGMIKKTIWKLDEG